MSTITSKKILHEIDIVNLYHSIPKNPILKPRKHKTNKPNITDHSIHGQITRFLTAKKLHADLVINKHLPIIVHPAHGLQYFNVFLEYQLRITPVAQIAPFLSHLLEKYLFHKDLIGIVEFTVLPNLLFDYGFEDTTNAINAWLLAAKMALGMNPKETSIISNLIAGAGKNSKKKTKKKQKPAQIKLNTQLLKKIVASGRTEKFALLPLQANKKENLSKLILINPNYHHKIIQLLLPKLHAKKDKHLLKELLQGHTIHEPIKMVAQRNVIGYFFTELYKREIIYNQPKYIGHWIAEHMLFYDELPDQKNAFTAASKGYMDHVMSGLKDPAEKERIDVSEL